ncbi:STAS domain-containing protein [Streptomyces sp. NPDC055210]
MPDRYTTADGVHVVTLVGDLDHAAREHIGNVLKPPADVTPARTVADLSGVQFMDSSGINMLITAYQNAAADGGWVRVAGAQAAAQRVIELVGLDTLIACYPTVEQALKG